MSDTMEASGRRGHLKIFLGYAAGVGKTFRMLVEVQRIDAEGQDVVVGYFEPHGRRDTIEQIHGLEVVPRRVLVYRGHRFEEMDTEAILRRRPAICAVDELPHSNVPGSAREKRWEDVMVLMDAGIDVLTTMNVQHVESLNDPVREISGVEVRETVPDWVLKEAGEVVLIDLPPQALLNRLARGVVYPPEKASRALESFFKEPTLAALREMALRQVAHEVDVRHARPDGSEAPRPLATGEAGERILIHVAEGPRTTSVIRRGRRVADYLKAECLAVAVLPPSGADTHHRSAAAAIEEHLSFARRLHVETHLVKATDVAKAVVDFARQERITQIFVAKPGRRTSFLRAKDTALQIVDLASDMQVTVVAERRPAGP